MFRRPCKRRRGARNREAGTALVEAALVLIVFLTMFFGVFEASIVLYVHHTLGARTSRAARYASMNPGDSIAIQNVVLSNDPSNGSDSGALGVTRAMVQVERTGTGTPADRVKVSVAGYQIPSLGLLSRTTFAVTTISSTTPVELE
jgi:Flp pilus assembly protein TadG